jgi:hypothetical protein
VQPIRSIVDRQSSLYQSNYAAMQGAVERLRGELKRSTEGGGEKYVKRHTERGKLLPRDRVEMLLDEGSYFLEIAPLAGHGMENEFPGAGSIGGVGLVCGRECVITANEATAKGGATSEAGSWKGARLADIARINHFAGHHAGGICRRRSACASQDIRAWWTRLPRDHPPFQRSHSNHLRGLWQFHCGRRLSARHV